MPNSKLSKIQIVDAIFDSIVEKPALKSQIRTDLNERHIASNKGLIRRMNWMLAYDMLVYNKDKTLSITDYGRLIREPKSKEDIARRKTIEELLSKEKKKYLVKLG